MRVPAEPGAKPERCLFGPSAVCIAEDAEKGHGERARQAGLDVRLFGGGAGPVARFGFPPALS